MYSAKKACTWGAMKWICIESTSRLGIGLESVCCGAQELRHCREVPITLLRVDVTEVDRQVGEQGLHVQTLLVPAQHTGDCARMAKRHQAGLAPTGSRLYGYALAQPSEPVMHGTILQVLSLFRHEKGPR